MCWIGHVVLGRAGVAREDWGKAGDRHSPPSCSEIETTAASAASLTHSSGPLWVSVLTKARGMPAQQAEPPKLWGSGRTKQRERRVLTGQRPPAFRAIRAGPRRKGHRMEAQAVQRELGESVLRDALALPSFLLQTHAQKGTS